MTDGSQRLAARLRSDSAIPFAGADRVRSYSELDALALQRASQPVELPTLAAGDPAAFVRQLSSSPSDLGTVGLQGDHGPKSADRNIRARLRHLLQSPSQKDAETELRKFNAAEVNTIRQATWTRAVGVLVANPKGGVGKTPSSLMLAGTLASIRGGSVCVVEVSDDPGALTFRAEGSPKLGLGELVRDVDNIHTAGQLAGYTAPQSSFASVVGTIGRRSRLSADNVRDVARAIDGYYAIRVMDSGNQTSSSAFSGAVAAADILVVPIYNTGDAVLEAINLLSELRDVGGHAAKLADQAVLLRLTDGRPENDAVVERIDGMLGAAAFASEFTVPFDPHIAERGQLTLDRLEPITRRAFTSAAAGIVRSLQSTVR